MKNKVFNILFITATIIIGALGIIATWNNVARETLAILRDFLISVFIIGLLLTMPKDKEVKEND